MEFSFESQLVKVILVLFLTHMAQLFNASKTTLHLRYAPLQDVLKFTINYHLLGFNPN